MTFPTMTFPMAGSTNKRCSKLVQSLADAEGRLSLSQMTVDRLVKENTTLSGLVST